MSYFSLAVSLRTRLALVGAVGLAALPSAAHADPCEGALPTRPGHVFNGAVRYVGDGDSLCVGTSDDPLTWVEVRLADFDAPELQSAEGRRSKTMLERIAFGRQIICTSVRGRSGRVVSYDRVIATCRIGGRTIGARLRSAGAPEGGN